MKHSHRELIQELQRRSDDMTPTKSQARGVRRVPPKQHGLDEARVPRRGGFLRMGRKGD
jgi:hypothetical protein